MQENSAENPARERYSRFVMILEREKNTVLSQLQNFYFAYFKDVLTKMDRIFFYRIKDKLNLMGRLSDRRFNENILEKK